MGKVKSIKELSELAVRKAEEKAAAAKSAAAPAQSGNKPMSSGAVDSLNSLMKNTGSRIRNDQNLRTQLEAAQPKTYKDFATAQELYDYRVKNTAENDKGNAASRAIQADIDAINQRRKELEREQWYHTADEMERINAQYSPEDAVYSPEQIALAREYESLPGYANQLQSLYTQRIGEEENARRSKKIQNYENVRNNADYSQRVALGKAPEAESWGVYYNKRSSQEHGRGAQEFSSVNRKSYAKDYTKQLTNPAEWAAANAEVLLEVDIKGDIETGETTADYGLSEPLYLYMTPEQRDVYSYYVATGGRKKADEYFDSIKKDLREIRNEARSAYQQEWAADNSVFAFGVRAINQPATIMTVPETIRQMAANSELFGDGIDRPLDTSVGAFDASRRSSAMTGGIMSTVDNEIGKFFLNVGFSLTDNAVAAGVGVMLGPEAAAMLLSAESAASSMFNAGQSGMSASDATKLGVISGGWEFMTEKMAFEELFDLFMKAPGKMTAAKLGRIFKQAGVEASEEYVNSVFSTMTERAVLGGNSSYDRYVSQMQAEGMTYDEAVDAANLQFYWLQPLESFASGFVSGGIMGTGGTILSDIVHSGNDNAAQSNMTESESEAVNTIAQISQRNEAGAGSIADAVAAKVLTGQSPTNAEIRQLRDAPVSVQRSFEQMTGVTTVGADSSHLRANIAVAVKNPAITVDRLTQYAGDAQYDDLTYNNPDASAVSTIDAARQGGAPLAVVNADDVGDAADMAVDFRQRQVAQREAANNGASLDTIANDRVRDKAKKLDRALETFGISNAVNASDLSSVHEVAAEGVLHDIIDSAARGIANTLENTPRYSEVQESANKYGLDISSYISEVIKSASGDTWSVATRGDVDLLGDAVNNPDAAAAIGSDAEQANKAKDGDVSVDADGNKLSQEQIDYFKNSKVRDKNGKLLKMYHGTSAFGFNAFDIERSNWGLLGPGFYFTSDSIEARWGYAQTRDQGGDKGVYETYLNITNPVPIDKKLTHAEWIELFDQLSVDEKTRSEFEQWLRRSASRTIEKFHDDMVFSIDLNSRGVSKREWLDAMRSRGWDGIIKNDPRGDGSSKVYAIAFNSEQIKRTDNRNPTNDSDIRFRLTGNQYNAPALEYALEEGTLNDTQLSNLATQLREHGIDLSDNPDTQELLEAVDMLDNVEPGFELTISDRPAKAKQPPKPSTLRKRATPEEKQRKAAEAEQKKAAVAERRAVPPAPKKTTKKAAKNATQKAPRQKSITSLAAEHKTGTAKVSGHNVSLTDPKAIARGLEGDARAEFVRQMESVNEFGKAFGHTVNYYYGRVGDADSGSAGFYNNGKIYVNVNSLRAAGLETAAHEVCHDIAANDPTFVPTFCRLYREYCESNGLMNEHNRRYNEIYNNAIYPDKQLAIAEEVLAGMFAERVKGDSEFLDYCLGKRPSIIIRIVEALNRILTRLHLKKYSKAAADAMKLRNFLLGTAARYQMNQTGRDMKLPAGIRSDYRSAQRKAEAIGDRYAVIADSGVNLTEWDTTGLASPDEYKNLRKTAPNEITDYGFKKVVVGKQLRNVLIVNPTRYISEGYRADMVAASRSLAASLGIRLGFITGQTSQTDGKAGSRRDTVINSDFIMTDDNTLYINLDSEVPYTKIVAGAWWSKFRKSNPAAAANLERLAERSGKLTGDDRIAQDYAVGMLTRPNAQGVKALALDPETLIKKLSDNKSAAYAFAHERPGIMRKLFENAGDMVAKLTGKQDYRAAYISGQLQARLLKAFSETDHNDPGDKINADKRRSAPEDVWFMYAGENARTADATALEQAKSMIDSGTDPETVRQETGWFKGMEGKWRFEIDDSKAQYYRAGDARFSRTHADYARHQTLLNKMLNGQISPEEHAELRKLDEIWGRERGRLNERVDRGNATLDEILDHEALFEAYPELRNVKVRFDVMYDGERGSYDRKSNTITLHSDLRNASEDTLLHEIQHAVQSIEGHSGGTSPFYWAAEIGTEEITRRLDGERREILSSLDRSDANKYARYEDLDVAMESMLDREDFENNSELQEHYERLEAESDELYRELHSHEWFRRLQDIRRQHDNPSEIYRNMYHNTAGEIEARDTAARRSLTPEQRKNTRPDIDREDVVFADNSRYNEARTRRFFGNNTFPPFNTSHSEANELATRWAHKPSVEAGDRALVSYHGRWYLIEKFNESELGYYIVDYVKKAEFNRIFEELKSYGKIIEGQSLIHISDEVSFGDRSRNRSEAREPSAYYDVAEYGREGSQIQPMGQNENSGRSSGDHRGPGNGSSFEDRQGSGTERLSNETEIRFSARRNNNAALREPTRTERRSWLDDYADTYGQIPEGESVNSRGDQRIPRRIDNETKTRQTYRTYAEALTTPDDFVGDLEKEIIDGRASYTPLSNKAAAGYAERKLAEGMDEAMATWNAVTHGDVIADKNQIALGERLIMEAINNRDVKLFTKLVSEVAAEATRAGQMVQAISMVKRLSPEGQLMSFQKEVAKLNEELANRKGHPQITPSETLTREYMDIASELEDLRKRIFELEGQYPDGNRTERQQDTLDSLEAREKKLEQELKDKKNEMITDAAEQMPPTWMDKLRAWRYLAMLGNPRTHIRNLLGNAVFIPAVRLKQGIAGAIESVTVKPGERTQGVRASKALRDFAREDAETQLDILASGGKYNQTDNITAQQKSFNDNTVIGKVLNKLADINSAALEGEDAFFLRKHYEFALSRFAAANRWSVDYLKSNPEALAKARGFAYREAQRATYRDMSSFAQLMSKTSNKMRKARGFGKLGYMMFEGALPFKKTPCNIMKRGIEYSPLGVASALSKGAIMLRDRRNGVESDYSGTEFINDLAAGMTGTMIMGLGYLMASLGMLHGRDKDEEDEINAIQGVQEYSVIVGGHSYTVDWVTPVAFPLFVGAELYDQISADRDGYSMDDLYDSLAGIAEPLFSLSMMDGIQSMMQSYSSEGAVFEAGMSAAESYLGQFFPTLSGQLARTVTPEVHTAYYRDKTDALPDFASGVLQQGMAKIPGLYDDLPEKIDVWGRNVGAGKEWHQRAAENFLSPGYLNRIETTDADRLVQELYRETGDTAVIPSAAAKYFSMSGERYDMAPDEYVKYAKTKGKTSYGILVEFSGSDEFRSLTPEQQVSCVETAYKFANAIAKSQTNSGYAIDVKWQREAYDAFLAGETTLAQAIIDYKTK